MAEFCASRPGWRPRPMHEGLQLASSAPLEGGQRTACPRCERSNAYYCCDCLLPLTPGVPTVPLPFSLFVCVANDASRRRRRRLTHGRSRRTKHYACTTEPKQRNWCAPGGACACAGEAAEHRRAAAPRRKHLCSLVSGRRSCGRGRGGRGEHIQRHRHRFQVGASAWRRG